TASGTVEVFTGGTAGGAAFGSGYNSGPLGVLVAPTGDVFVGQSSGQNSLLDLSSAGAVKSTFFPAYDNGGIGYLELTDDGGRVLYSTQTAGSSQTGTVKNFDIANNHQNPDFATNLPGGPSFAIRELNDKSVLVANTIQIAHLDSNGNVLASPSLTPPAGGLFYALNLNPDGASFWTGDALSGKVYQIRITDGALLNTINTGLGFNSSALTFNTIFGIAVLGQPQSGGADLSVTMSGPATVTSGGNLVYSIVVTNNGPLTALGVTLTDPVPAGLSPLFITGPAVCTRIIQLEVGTTISCAIGTMASGASETFGFTINPTTAVTNTATVAGTSPSDPLLANNSASLTTTISVSAPTLNSIAVTPANPSVAKGKTQQFTATGTYSDNSTQNLTNQVTWASATTSVATITAGGLATAVAATGTSSISATLGTVKGSTVLTATAAVLQSIAVTPANPSIAKGKTQQFTATGTFSDGTTQNLTSTVTWASATTSVATITTGGLATGVATGTSNISATQSGITGSTVLTVMAAALQSIAVTPANPSVPKGKTQQFTATGTFSDNSTQNLTSSVTWASATTSVATINAAGLATALATGTSSISATLSGVTGSTVMTVTAAVLQSIAVTPANPSIVLGKQQQFTATGTFSDNTTQNLTSSVTWSSGTLSVATINAAGLASSVGTGTSAISAVQSGVTGSTVLTVISVPLVPTFSSTTLPAGTMTVPYGADIQVTGGTAPYTFGLANGSTLPTGFTLDATATGSAAAGHIFNSNPATTGTFTFDVTVTDSTTPTPQQVVGTIALTIGSLPPNTKAALLNGQYAIKIRIFNEVTGTEEGVLGSLNLDGKGGLTGVIDDNFNGAITMNHPVTGS
ncbi:MAG: Ig-like domain-containing protein, partial [Candidatus Acidiferrales bacterium]